jgi:hypothetical protein
MRGGEDYRNASLSDYWRQVDLLDGRQLTDAEMKLSSWFHVIRRRSSIRAGRVSSSYLPGLFHGDN